MVDPATALYSALDTVSFGLAAIVALFFWRTHTLRRDQSLWVLAGAFGLLALVDLSRAVAVIPWFSGIYALNALRLGGIFVAAVLILLAAIVRVRGTPASVLSVVAATAFSVGAIVVLLLLVPGVSIRPSGELFPWLRLLESLLFAASALLVAFQVRATNVGDLAVPAAYLCLSFSRYTVALLGFEEVLAPSPLAYAWRLLGLIILASVVVRRWPRGTP